MNKLITPIIWLCLLLAAVCIAPFTAIADPAGAEWPDLALPVLAIGGFIDLRSYFNPKSIAQYLTVLPTLKSPVIDNVFPDRPQIPFAIVGSDIVNQVIRAQPLNQRGKRSIPITGGTGQTTYYEPLPINPDTFISAADLVNLKLLGESGRQKWALQQFDVLRRTIRETTEAITAVARHGTFSWPVQLEGGVMTTYEASFGSPLSVEVSKLFDAEDCKVTHVFELLELMKATLEENGYGSTRLIWAGKTVYSKLLAMVGTFAATAKMKVELTDNGINIGGYIIQSRTEKHRNPDTGAMVPVVGDNELMMIATDAGHKMPYCAVDDLDANLQPLPMFAKPLKKDNPSGIELVGQSKPFPSPNMYGIVKVTVISE